MRCLQRKLFGKSVDSLFLLLDLFILLLDFVCRFLLANYNPFLEDLISSLALKMRFDVDFRLFENTHNSLLSQCHDGAGVQLMVIYSGPDLNADL